MKNKSEKNNKTQPLGKINRISFLRWMAVFAICLAGIRSGSITVMAEESVQNEPFISNNAGKQAYGIWASVKTSELNVQPDGTFERVEAGEDGVHVEHYNADAVFTDSKLIEMELPLYGGSYTGTNYHFLVFGQDNLEESDGTEVIRVVRYDADWNRIDQVSLYGANTYKPFEAGCLRMVQEQDMLYIRTSHQIYQTEDKKHHQTNMTLAVHIGEDGMKITHHQTEIAGLESGYVSHSFNQFITSDGTDILAADHGDAYPRAMVLLRFQNAAGTDTLNRGNHVSVFPFTGRIGENVTKASLGGLEVSDQAYLVAGNSSEQSEENNASKPGYPRNIFLTVTDKDNFSEEGTTVHWMTNYQYGEDGVSTPHLVKISGKRFLMMWMRNDALNYQFIDGEGNMIGTLYQKEGVYLSDCEPVYQNGKIFWYTTKNSRPAIYSLDAEDGSLNVLDQPDLNDAYITVSLWDQSYAYKNAPIQPEVKVNAVQKDQTYSLSENSDYTVTYQDNINAGEASVIVQGTGIYTGKITVHFTISPVGQNTGYYDESGNYHECGEFVYPHSQDRFLNVGAQTKVIAGGVGTITYTSLTPSIATVDADGTVTAVSAGMAAIQVDISGGGNWMPYTRIVEIPVYENEIVKPSDDDDTTDEPSHPEDITDRTENSGVSDDPGDEITDNEEEPDDDKDTDLLEKGSLFMTSGVIYKVTGTRQAQYVKSAKKQKGSVRIPDTVYFGQTSYKVTSIAAKAFRKNTKITAVTIGKNIKSIGKQAFYGCKKLKKITIRTTALTEKKIGSAAFKGIAKKASVKLPQKLTAKQKKNYKKWLKKQGFA